MGGAGEKGPRGMLTELSPHARDPWNWWSIHSHVALEQGEKNPTKKQLIQLNRSGLACFRTKRTYMAHDLIAT